MSFQNNNITIIPITGYNPSFSWQVGFASDYLSGQNLQFRATVRPLHGLENFTRVPSQTILFQQTGIFINSVTQQGQWNFPLKTNAMISGGPYRDYQVVIEAHDTDGYTSAGNYMVQGVENGWTMYNQGYDILAVQNPRQTGIELGNNLPTQTSISTGNNFLGATGSGFYINSGNGYASYNYLGTHGEISIRYISGQFNSNIVGGYLYVWTGQFPKLETLLGSGIYGSGITKSKFDFDPTKGYVYHPQAGVPFRGANSVYVSISFFDNLDAIAIQNGINVASGLYLSDNAICYNDISAGSITIGGYQTIYAMQYTGSMNPTGILGTGTPILSSKNYKGNTSVLYLSNPIITSGFGSNYTGYSSIIGGGMGGHATLLNNIATIQQNTGLLTPLMTSNTTPYGIASASLETNPAYQSFDRNVGTTWFANATLPQWLQYQFNSPALVSSYDFSTTFTNGIPNIYDISGSNDGTNWNLVSNQNSYSNNNYYSYYRLYVTQSIIGGVPSTSYTQVREWNLYGYSY